MSSNFGRTLRRYKVPAYVVVSENSEQKGRCWLSYRCLLAALCRDVRSCDANSMINGWNWFVSPSSLVKATLQAVCGVSTYIANIEIVTYIHQQELQDVCNIMLTVENARISTCLSRYSVD